MKIELTSQLTGIIGLDLFGCRVVFGPACWKSRAALPFQLWALGLARGVDALSAARWLIMGDVMKNAFTGRLGNLMMCLKNAANWLSLCLKVKLIE